VAFAALNALGRAYLLVGKTSSRRTTSKQAKCIEGHGPLFGRPIVDDVQLLRQDCVRDHRQFVNRALDFIHGDQRIAVGHTDWSSCDFIGKYGAGKRRFGVIVRRDSRATLC